MSVLSKYFSDPDLKEIKLAVKDAELKTSAEIVPFFAEASHHYEDSKWMISGISGMLFGGLLLALDSMEIDSWHLGVIEGIAAVWIGSLIGYLAGSFSPSLRVFFVSKSEKLKFVQTRAKVAFLEEEIFRTEERIGVLIYFSLTERMTVVLPDSGISKLVPQSEWETVVGLITSGMKGKQKKDGIIKAIWYCGDLLEKYGVRVKKVNRNEISDDLRSGGTKL